MATDELVWGECPFWGLFLIASLAHFCFTVFRVEESQALIYHTGLEVPFKT